jgi:hypothetical protein
LFFSLLQSLGYLFGARTLFGITRFTGIALPTAVSLFLMSLGIFLTADNCRVVALLRSNGAGGVLVRRLLPPALILPPPAGPSPEERRLNPCGHQFHIAKPLDPPELLSTLAKMCG